MASDRERSNSPMGRTPLRATVMNVKMCCAKCEEKAKEECEEVEGVVKVVTNQSEDKVIVYGAADPPALLKKMRRHLDKHAMYWPMDDTNQDQVAPPLFPVDPRELNSHNRGGPPLQTGTVLSVDRRDGRPLVDSREIRQAERELQDTEIRERAGRPHNVPRDVNNHGLDGGPREVVFVPVDAKDGTPVDPRTVRKVEPAGGSRDGRTAHGVDARDLVHPVERMELRGEYPRPDPNHGAPGMAPREVVYIPVDAKDGSPVDPRRVHQVDPSGVDATGRPITSPNARPGHSPELREVRPIHDPRDPHIELRDVRPIHDPPVRELHEVRPIDPREPGRLVDASELRPIDPRGMMRHGNPREVQHIDPHLRSIDPRDGRPALNSRDMDPRDGRAASAAYGSSEPPPRDSMRGVVPEGLMPVRTGRDSREVHFAPTRSNNLSPTQGPRDMGPRSPRVADMSRSPRQHAPDYGPRSPRDEYGPRSPRDYSGADHGPRSPRFEGATDYSGPRSPRFGATDYSGPRSPRFEGATDFSGPRSPRFGATDYSGPRSPRGRAGDHDPIPQRAPAMRPVLDRELSFNQFGPGHDPQGVVDMDQGRTTGRVVPMPYEPVDPRDAAAFDFHGGGGATAPHPRSPRSGGHLGPAGPNQPPLVRGYGDIDPRQFRPPGPEPRVLLDVTHELQGGNAGIRYKDSRDYINDPAIRDRDRDDVMNYRRGGLDGSPRRPLQQHVSQYSEFREGEADVLQDYQPKESYFSDYHPSQNYQPGPLATQEIDQLPVLNPNYKKHINVGPDQF
ncbi:hypothetical protein KC19_5G046800 [Ceratodon purpureus]|uniref:HMA domain-containing protein n=1 Tax=Ceratodon purpureus TaxID=3225 RepID=A0A8T0I002_CERPU|nr:hypothetical protein KC19_5G046800 [Ceratodon purpureus]